MIVSMFFKLAPTKKGNKHSRGETNKGDWTSGNLTLLFSTIAQWIRSTPGQNF
jgi:hypothetical protein